jgi:hypothetical protein
MQPQSYVPKKCEKMRNAVASLRGLAAILGSGHRGPYLMLARLKEHDHRRNTLPIHRRLVALSLLILGVVWLSFSGRRSEFSALCAFP